MPIIFLSITLQFLSCTVAIFHASIASRFWSKRWMFFLGAEALAVYILSILYYRHFYFLPFLSLLISIPLLSLALSLFLYGWYRWTSYPVLSSALFYLLVGFSYQGLFLSNAFLDRLPSSPWKHRVIQILLAVNPSLYLSHYGFSLDLLHRYFYNRLWVAQYYFFTYPPLWILILGIVIFIALGSFFLLI